MVKAAKKMIQCKINDIDVQVPEGSSILQACEKLGVVVPRFCYHQGLSVAGNCRMCLVEVRPSPKLQASCAMPVMPNAVVYTDTPAVQKAREGIMEFLLINHPLDCPICDQGGECDLQDQAMRYGSDHGRFEEYKRAVEEKPMGPLIKTIMTRCIHCTRCIRFASEIAGDSDFGTMGRGNSMEITTSPFPNSLSSLDELREYLGALDSELTGNLIDVCPVGAITSLPYAFTARSWELKSIETTDLSDALCTPIRVDCHQATSGPGSIMRILPQKDWISDKTRFAYDGLKSQRLTQPMLRNEEGQLVQATWPEVMERVREVLEDVRGAEIEAYLGAQTDAESFLAFRDLGFDPILEIPSSSSPKDVDKNYEVQNKKRANFDLGLQHLSKKIEDADLCLLVGANPRMEASILQAKMREACLQGKLKVANLGANLSASFPVQNLGHSTRSFIEIYEGRHPFCAELMNAKSPLIIVGNHLLTRSDGSALWSLLQDIQSRYLPNSLQILHTGAGSLSSILLGMSSTKKNSSKDLRLIYLLNYGEDAKLEERLKNTPKHLRPKIIYQGYHGESLAKYAEVILPGSAPTEKEGSYLNAEGFSNQTRIATRPPGEAREDWRILTAVQEVISTKSSWTYKTQKEIRKKLEGLGFPAYGKNLVEVKEDKKKVYLRQQKSKASSLFLNKKERENLWVGSILKEEFFLVEKGWFPEILSEKRKEKEEGTPRQWYPSREEWSKINLTPLFTLVDNFYMTDSLTRNSSIMAASTKNPRTQGRWLSPFSYKK